MFFPQVSLLFPCFPQHQACGVEDAAAAPAAAAPAAPPAAEEAAPAEAWQSRVERVGGEFRDAIVDSG